MDTSEQNINDAAPSMQLLSYQVGEVKGLVQNISRDFSLYRNDTDKRLNELEKFQAAQIQQDKTTPKIDAQKIILTLIAFASSVAALALGYYNVHK